MGTDKGISAKAQAATNRIVGCVVGSVLSAGSATGLSVFIRAIRGKNSAGLSW
jgi:uncharacterized membrane protein YgaE (UPF0421/DUF939 family)